MITHILIIAMIFLFGVSTGYLIKMRLARKDEFSGTLFVTHEEHKTLYSLELSEYPEKLEFKKVVVLKVESLDQGFGRE